MMYCVHYFVELRCYFSLITLENKLTNTLLLNISRVLLNQHDKSAIDHTFCFPELLILLLYF